MTNVYRYTTKNESGDIVEAIVAEPGSLFIRSHDGQYADWFGSPGGDLRSFLVGCDGDYIANRFRSRVPGHKLTQHAAKDMRADVLALWPRLREAIREDLRAIATESATTAAGAEDVSPDDAHTILKPMLDAAGAE